MRALILLSLGLLLFGCEDFFNQELTGLENDYQPELSLFTLLQPKDSLIIVDVRRTIPAIGGITNEEDFRRVVPDARVTISNGITTVPLVYSDFPIEGYLALQDTLPDDFLCPGESYTIEAQHEALSARGTVNIPLDSIAREDIRFQVVEEREGDFLEVEVIADIPNQPGDNEFYVMIVERSSAPNFDFRRRELHDFVRGRQSLGDRLAFEPVLVFEFNRTTLQLCVAEAATYNFLSIRSTAINNNDNPFAEPTLLPTNVEDGVGHLGGLNCQFFSFTR